MYSKACAALLRGANQGDVDAMVRLVHRFIAGDGVPQDPDQAQRWALAAADAGSPRGAYLAGLLLAERGVSGKGSLEQAKTLLRRAAESGYGHAAEVLEILRTGQIPAGMALKACSGKAGSRAAAGGEPAAGGELSVLEAKSRAGDPGALFVLGYALYTGQGVEGVVPDAGRGLSMVEQSAAKGYAPAQLALAEWHFNGELPASDPARGAAWLAEAARNRDAHVLANCAAVYAQGRKDLPPDDKLALSCQRRAADLGHAVSQYQVALRLSTGQGLPKNLAKAAVYARKAAEQGVVEACSLLGGMYSEGGGVEASQKKAFFWYSKAADAGDEEALAQKAYMLAHGDGCRQDRALAREMLEGLVLGGNADAEFMLADLLAGSKDSAEDAARGRAMLRKLAGEGDRRAQMTLAVAVLADGADAGPEAEKAARAESLAWLEKAAAQSGSPLGAMLADRLGKAWQGGARRRPGLARRASAARRKKA